MESLDRIWPYPSCFLENILSHSTALKHESAIWTWNHTKHVGDLRIVDSCNKHQQARGKLMTPVGEAIREPSLILCHIHCSLGSSIVHTTQLLGYPQYLGHLHLKMWQCQSHGSKPHFPFQLPAVLWWADFIRSNCELRWFFCQVQWSPSHGIAQSPKNRW